ncbi:MAG TPA: HAD-IIB family hydrolase [Kofleriaceae bacterium]
MRYHVLATDYDGTLAHHGRVDDATWAAVHKFRDTGRKLILVTGRELDELLALLPDATVFDRIVAENGALVYDPATKEIATIAPGPPADFVAELAKRGVEPIAVGRVIVATWEPHQDTVLATIRDMGLELQVIFNKGAVMILPSGVNKATGLALALTQLGLSAHNVVAVGDAENDHALLASAECGVAVANSLPALINAADLVTKADHGAGVAELIDHLLTDDLATVAPRLKRHAILLGKTPDGKTVEIDPYAANIMVCGTSGSGKSTLTTGVLERLAAASYQFAILDPEGDFTTTDLATVLGAPNRAPLVDEMLDVLGSGKNVAANLLGIAVDHRPEVFAQLVPALVDLRVRTGRPHWLIIDEAHHLLPVAWSTVDLPIRAHGTLYITVHPGSVNKDVVETINTVIAVGEHPEQTIRELCDVLGRPMPHVEPVDKLAPGTCVYWRLDQEPVLVISEKAKAERMRHSRKYSEGNLGKDRSFVFRGPEAKLSLSAPNLHMFLHMADGVDDDTWTFHLRAHDYSAWMRTQVKDVSLADEVVAVENDTALSPLESRAAIRAAVEKRYTLPSDKPSGIIDAAK